MDPNATLERIVIAAISGNSNDFIEAAQDLGEWLDDNGFPPDKSALTRLMEGD